MMTLEDLQKSELALVMEVGQLQHELRRVKDGLERTGGRHRELESKAKQLTENISICERELAQTRRLMQEIND